MKIIEPSFTIIDPIDGKEILKKLEACARTCYKSEGKTTENSAKGLVSFLIKHGHESVLEHVNISVRFVTSRGVTPELVRHRLASYSQESTRYCNYYGEMSFIKPLSIKGNSAGEFIFTQTCLQAEEAYKDMLSLGYKPEDARDVLPNALKTEIVMTCNLREWRHMLRLRTDKTAHPEIRRIMIPLLRELKTLIPVVFDDICSVDDEVTAHEQ